MPLAFSAGEAVDRGSHPDELVKGLRKTSLKDLHLYDLVLPPRPIELFAAEDRLNRCT